MNDRHLSATPSAGLDAFLGRASADARQMAVDMLAARTQTWTAGLAMLADGTVPARRRLRLARRGFHALTGMQRKGTDLARGGLPDDLAHALARLPGLLDQARDMMA